MFYAYIYGIITIMIMSTGMGSDSYNIDLLKVELHKIGFDLIYFPQVHNTMRIVEEYTLHGQTKPVVALADHQIEGQGRSERKWLDIPYRSLMFSLLFTIPQEEIATLADMTSLAVCQALRDEFKTYDIKIKYPNDIVYEDKKLGGLLLKNIYDRQLRYAGTNTGIGLNIHYNSYELNEFGTDYPAISLDNCVGTYVKRQNLLLVILKALRFLSAEVGVFHKNSYVQESYNKKWKEYSGIYNRKIEILKNDKIIESGVVVNTEISRGIELENKSGRKWISLFETDMKVRIIN